MWSWQFAWQITPCLFLVGQSLGVAVSENKKKKCIQRSLCFIILPNYFPPVLQQVKDCVDCEDSPVSKEDLRECWHVGWRKEKLPHTNPWLVAPKKEKHFLTLSGCQKEGSCLLLCIPQAADDISYHFRKLTDVLMESFLTALPPKELFMINDRHNGRVVD